MNSLPHILLHIQQKRNTSTLPQNCCICNKDDSEIMRIQISQLIFLGQLQPIRNDSRLKDCQQD